MAMFDLKSLLSENSYLQDEERQQLKELGLKSVIVLPIVINGSISMYAAFSESVKERIWQVEEIKMLKLATE